MSVSYQSATETPSATLAALQRLPSEIRAPIAQATPYIIAVFSFLKLAFSFILNLFSPLLHLSPLPILQYLLAPLFVFLDIATTIFIRTPYRTAAYLLEALFPLYVLVGVACITGVLLGACARVTSRVLVASLVPEESASSDTPVVKTEKTEQDVKKMDSQTRTKRGRANEVKIES
ncbi:hypothetical protein BDN70DRAFT_879913 [Pholiota conissans]|uniref:Uncharacterized protein n=1 Tax=Pholiota conissans TaxID=109636 RepID=A0A9P6CTJ1_9AGAR|nr:hypothetical protein BDN70DRAFT_879913 [Pholiota conissans]